MSKLNSVPKPRIGKHSEREVTSLRSFQRSKTAICEVFWNAACTLFGLLASKLLRAIPISGSQPKKAQMLTADYVASLTVFATVITIGLLLWNVADGKKNWAFDIDRMQKKAMTAADALVTGGGLPPGWTPANVEEIGISTSDHVINGTLVDNMLGVYYPKAKIAFGLEIYDFYVNITNYTGGAIASYGIPPANARDLAVTQRIAFFQNGSAPVRATVSFYVWRK